MRVHVTPALPLSLEVACRGVVVQTYRFMLLRPDGSHVEVAGSNTEGTIHDVHLHEMAAPFPAGTVLRGVLSYSTANGVQPYADSVRLIQNSIEIPMSRSATESETSVSGTAARFVDYTFE